MKVINRYTHFVGNDINPYRLAKNEYIFEIVIDGIQFLATGKGNLYKAEKMAIDKVAEYCIEDDDYAYLIYTIEDLADYDTDKIYEMSDEELSEYIKDRYYPCCNYQYFIPNKNLDVTEVTDEVREDDDEMRNDIGKVFDSFYGDKEYNIMKRMKEENWK